MTREPRICDEKRKASSKNGMGKNENHMQKNEAGSPFYTIHKKFTQNRLNT